MRILLFCLCLFVLSACSTASYSIRIREEFFSTRDLASVKVGTPDPLKRSFKGGKRLIVKWRVPKRSKGAVLALTIRFGDKTEKKVSHPLPKRYGMYVYSSFGDEYFGHGEIESYRAEIIIGDRVMHDWKHKLWTKQIHLDDSK